MDRKDDYKRTIAYGEAAIGQLKANRTPAYPRNYELWYTYAAGFNKPLNGAINAVLREHGHISPNQTDDIYERHLAKRSVGEQVDEVGGRVSDEIDRIMEFVSTNALSTSSYGASLEGATQALGRTEDREQIRSIVETLISVTQSIGSNNKALESQLAESKRQIETLKESLETVRYESLTDELTTLANRKHLRMTLDRALREAEKSGVPVALLMSDIDHFKTFNDRYGHQTGDQVLRLVAAAVRQNIKGRDVAARYGGEEFAVVLPETNLDQAAVVAEQIRSAVMNKELVKRSTGEELGRITISIGCAESRRDDTMDSIVARADACLYAAKKAGRNRVSVEAAAHITANVA